MLREEKKITYEQIRDEIDFEQIAERLMKKHGLLVWELIFKLIKIRNEMRPHECPTTDCGDVR
jgi:hypothetical protein